MPPKANNPSQTHNLLAPGRVNFNGFRFDRAERLTIGFGGGIWALADSVRSFGGSIQARMGATILSSSLPSGCTSAIDFIIVRLSGVMYCVAAFGDGVNTRLYVTQSLTFPITWTEITETNGFEGNTRFTGVATKIAFGTWLTQRNVTSLNFDNGSRDVLMISDGTTARVYDPTGWGTAVPTSSSSPLWIHTNIIEPGNAAQFTQVGGFHTFTQLAGATRTYQTAHTTVQPATYRFDDSSAAPYTSTNVLPKLTENVGPVGSMAGFPLASQVTFDNLFGAQLVMGVEAIAGTFADWLLNTRISWSPNLVNLIAIASSTNASPIVVTTAINHGLVDGDSVEIRDHVTNTNANGVHFAKVTGAGGATKFALFANSALTVPVVGNGVGGTTGTVIVNRFVVYDPTETTDNTYNNPVFQGPLDPGSVNRQVVVFDTSHLTSALQGQPNQRTVGYLFFERLNAASAASLSMVILFMAAGGTLPGGTTLAIAYTDRFGWMEGKGYNLPLGVTTDLISAFGGPTFVTGASPIPAPNFPPPIQQIFFDYSLTVQNPVMGTGFGPNGSPAGTPNAIAVYMQPLGAPTADFVFWIGLDLIGVTGSKPTWSFESATKTITFKTSDSPTNEFNGTSLSEGRVLPTTSQLSIPPSSTYWNAYGRFFAGQPLIDSGVNFGEIWFSQKDFSNRFMATPLDTDQNENEDFGSRVLLTGQTIEVMIGNSDGNGQNELLCLTDVAMYQIGALAEQGTSYPASRLATPTFISSHGTLSPYSAIDALGTLTYVDQYSDIIQYSNGQTDNISLRAVGDLILGIPAGRIGQISGGSLGKRLYFGITPSGGSFSNKVLVRDMVAGNWEALDTLPATWDFQRVRTFNDATFPGAGQRLICMAHDGKFFGYEENASTDFGNQYVQCSLTTGFYWDDRGRAFLDDAAVWGHSESGQSMTVTRFNLETGAQYATQILLYNPLNPTTTYFASTEGADNPVEIPSQSNFTVVTVSTSMVVQANAAVTILGPAGGVARALADGDPITIAGVVGNVNANGTYYAKVSGAGGAAFFDLFVDQALTTPVTYGGTPYASGGTIQVITGKPQGAYRCYARYDWPYAPGKQIDRIAQTVTSVAPETGDSLGASM